MTPWPATLPQAPLLDFELVPRSGLAAPEEALTPERTRTYPEYEGTFSFVLTMEQWTALRAFYETDLNGGCAPFAGPWLALLGLSHHFLRMLNPPACKTYDRYRVKATLTVEVIAGVPVGADGAPAVWVED